MSIRPPLRWFGGKWYLKSEIINLLPAHRVYTEPYGGCCSVLLNKPAAPIEIYNDLNYELVNFFKVLRDSPDKLIKQLFLTPYSREEFERSFDKLELEIDYGNDELERARRFYIRYRQSMAGIGKVFSTCTVKRTRRGCSDVVSGWLSSIEDNLERVVERLRTVQIECIDGIKCIEKYDCEDCVHYVDCPYVHSTRVGNDQYGEYEMTDAQHIELANVLNKIKGRALVSGYRCDLYDNLYKNWRRVEFDLPNNSAKGKTKQRRIETLYLNYET